VNRKSILIADDEPKILKAVASFFESRGFNALTAENGRRALEIFDAESPELVVLDLMLPDISGERVCSELRRRSRVPIIMLTAKAAEEDLIAGLSLGADDYVTKPFSLKELYARAQAVLRRVESERAPQSESSVSSARRSFRNGELTIDFEENAVRKNGVLLNLPPSEAGILYALAKRPGKTFTRDELIELALGGEFDGFDRAIDNHIKNLRRKIEDDTRRPVYILTAHGLGYRFGGE
jgi:DNA-binding response OmpR family regulator